MEDNIIVALELGSSHVVGVAGHKQTDGGMQIMAVAKESSSSFIRKGVVFNLDKTAESIGNITKKLEKTLHKKITRAYVGVSGKGIHTVKNQATKDLNAQVSVSQELVDMLLDMNRNAVMADCELLEVVPQEYKVGSAMELNPVGVLTDSIEGNFVNVVARPVLRSNLEMCMETANLDIAGRPISYLALGKALLSDSERRSGCVLVDMGAGTTTVAIYKSNLLRYLTVLPIGGENITRDIMTIFAIDFREADTLKTKYGLAYTAPPADDERSADAVPQTQGVETTTLEDGRSVKLSDLNEIVQARMEEIICNVNEQIKSSLYGKDQLLGGMILTGGASRIKLVEKAFAEYTKFTKIRIAHNLQLPVRVGQGIDIANSDAFNAAISILETGNENCCEELSTPSGTLFTEETTSAGIPTTPAKPAAAASTPVDDTEAKKRAEQARIAAEKEAAEKAAEAERKRVEREAEKERKAAEKAAKKEKRKAFWNKFKSAVSGMVSEEPDREDDEK